MKADVRMTSVDLVELTGKQHKNIMRDIRGEIEKIEEVINAPPSLGWLKLNKKLATKAYFESYAKLIILGIKVRLN